MSTSLDLPSPGDLATSDKWGLKLNTAITAVRDTADAAVAAAGSLDGRVTTLESGAGQGAWIPTFATKTAALAAITADTIPDGGVFAIEDPAS